MTKQVDLFTAEEHLVLARWLRQEPLERPVNAVDIDDIVSGWGFDCDSDVYASIDAAAASIVLERIQDRLPNYYLRIGDIYDEPEIWRGRNIAKRKAVRKIELTPQSLFTVNWGGGPGYDWPVEYCVTWIPLYNRFIVTASADCDEANGACDFALGQFEFTRSYGRMGEHFYGADVGVAVHHPPRHHGARLGLGLGPIAQAGHEIAHGDNIADQPDQHGCRQSNVGSGKQHHGGGEIDHDVDHHLGHFHDDVPHRQGSLHQLRSHPPGEIVLIELHALAQQITMRLPAGAHG